MSKGRLLGRRKKAPPPHTPLRKRPRSFFPLFLDLFKGLSSPSSLIPDRFGVFTFVPRFRRACPGSHMDGSICLAMRLERGEETMAPIRHSQKREMSRTNWRERSRDTLAVLPFNLPLPQGRIARRRIGVDN